MTLRTFTAVLILLLPACASAQQTRAQISIDALVADAPAYVAARYQPDELPNALITDLTAQEFQCRQSADASACERTRHAFASCFDVVTVRISAGAVAAAQNRRCLGAQR